MTGTILGIDVGGTKVVMALYDEASLHIIKTSTFETRPHRGFKPVLTDIVHHAKLLLLSTTRAVGIGMPGFIQRRDGMILTLPNIPGADRFPLRTFLETELRVPVFVANDSQCFTLAEARDGAGKGCSVVVGITMGTGVGGGIVIDGSIFEGADGFAAEIGHALLQPGHPPAGSKDHRGDVEQFLSGTALHRRCASATSPEDILSGSVCSHLHPLVIREVAWLCTSLTHILNPSIIVFGGSAGRALAPHLRFIRTEIRHWLLAGIPSPVLSIRTLEDAATRGAALLTLDTATR